MADELEGTCGMDTLFSKLNLPPASAGFLLDLLLTLKIEAVYPFKM
jgi:hypothetical protein